ncbi:hypothetical protein [Rhizobium leguminosarum]|uniref:hypothetical protein n=1 Tax=Rhizobium leguminosarum TaxID=384 RepID=UPI00098EF335|nr:hypothetical protein [Rhizobium leguminosarum]MBB5255993.1 hypothetical protein [Rhizobium leguminosarum]MDX6001311.1 hypothetical protein [Rhizobium leguminosarum]OOO44039.1 hypothetical protein BS629_28175 [Rhizobium leguminosarum bv. viciae USDA 2370]PUB63226.1 hypothetical protein DB728_16085 [Rhizobium leguminosarum bv. viciae USDA 2370]TCA82268.1 hypothetical protein E0H74_20900 [Rhizobium leguminosarum bv. viciae]
MKHRSENIFDPFAIFGTQGLPHRELDPASYDQEDEYVPQDVRPNTLDVVAKLFWAENGGPIRTIIDGRKTRPTGTFHAIKGGARAMPWESKLERTAMCLADFSTRVHYLLAQPHRLEISVRGNRGRPLIYFPDLLLQVHPSFVEDLRRGMPFSQAACKAANRDVPPHRLQNLLLEIKADKDPRDDDPAYQHKLRLAQELYHRRGFAFFTIRQSVHLDKQFTAIARRGDLHKYSTLDECDFATCLAHFGERNTVPLASLQQAFGDGPSAQAKVVALHYRRFISIDLTAGPNSGSPVHLIDQGAGR